jgi:hypothetical protein
MKVQLRILHWRKARRLVLQSHASSEAEDSFALSSRALSMTGPINVFGRDVRQLEERPIDQEQIAGSIRPNCGCSAKLFAY